MNVPSVVAGAREVSRITGNRCLMIKYRGESGLRREQGCVYEEAWFRGVDLTAQGELTSIGALGVAPGVSMGIGSGYNSEHVEWESAEPYVFAFRLREVYYRQGTDFESKAYTTGALYSQENEEKAKETVSGEEGKAETQIRMTAEEDVTLHDLLLEDQAGWKMIAATDENDEAECVCISMLDD